MRFQLFVLAAFALALPAAAQEPEPDPVSPEAVAFVRDMQARNNPDGLVRRMLAGVTPMLMQRDHLDQAAADHLVNDYIGPAMEERYGRQVDRVARIWSAHFSDEELRRMHDFLDTRTPETQQAFQATPLGRKFAAEFPAIDAAENEATRKWAGTTMAVALNEHADEVRALGVDPTNGKLIGPPGDK